MSYSPLLDIITGTFEFAAAIIAFVSPGRKHILYPPGQRESGVLCQLSPHKYLYRFFDPAYWDFEKASPA